MEKNALCMHASSASAYVGTEGRKEVPGTWNSTHGVLWLSYQDVWHKERKTKILIKQFIYKHLI